MSREYQFLKECGYFYVLTMNGTFPAGRPFGAVMEEGDFLYIATHDGNEAHSQLRNNGNIQILAKKEGVREWLRITGKAEESKDQILKQKFMEECPVLVKHYETAKNEHFLMFKIEKIKVEFK